MLISKKDLLVQTGISYGQLYRWKRERLIPEEWFIKQPSFTGQETYFPKDKILTRIRAIQELKDRYPLEELAKLLSPEVAERSFTAQDLEVIEEIDDRAIPAIIQGYGKSILSYVEVLIAMALCQSRQRHDISLGAFIHMIEGIQDQAARCKNTQYILTILVLEDQYYVLLYQESAQLLLDGRLRVLESIPLDDLSSQMKIKYRKKFRFVFEDGRHEAVDNGHYEYANT